MNRSAIWIRTKRALATLTTALAASAVLGVIVGVATLLGPQFPTADDIPDVPDGYSLGPAEPGCGSGGCYLESVVTGPPGVSPEAMLETLRPTVSDCGSRGILDRRRQCTGIAIYGDEVRVSVALRDPFD